MPTVEYLPVATDTGANVDSQANFAGSGYQTVGFQPGLAKSAQCNKVWRQASMICAAAANFIANILGINVLDDGNISALTTNLTNAIEAAAQNTANRIVTVAYSPTAVFDCSQGNSFKLTLTGDCTPSVINFAAGQRLTFIIAEDGTGGHAFTPPANLPMSPISTAAGKRNVQAFIVDTDGLTVLQVTPLTVQ